MTQPMEIAFRGGTLTVHGTKALLQDFLPKGTQYVTAFLQRTGFEGEWALRIRSRSDGQISTGLWFEGIQDTDIEARIQPNGAGSGRICTLSCETLDLSPAERIAYNRKLLGSWGKKQILSLDPTPRVATPPDSADLDSAEARHGSGKETSADKGNPSGAKEDGKKGSFSAENGADMEMLVGVLRDRFSGGQVFTYDDLLEILEETFRVDTSDKPKYGHVPRAAIFRKHFENDGPGKFVLASNGAGKPPPPDAEEDPSGEQSSVEIVMGVTLSSVLAELENERLALAGKSDPKKIAAAEQRAAEVDAIMEQKKAELAQLNNEYLSLFAVIEGPVLTPKEADRLKEIDAKLERIRTVLSS